MSTSSSYQFIPRKLIKRKLNGSADPQTSSAKLSAAPSQPSVVSRTTIDLGQKQQSAPRLLDEHIAIWIHLAMSDHAVWSDPDLRRMLDSGDELENYIPLRFLLHNSTILAVAVDELERVSEAQVVKALRAHSPTTFDIRVLISEPSKATWSTGYNTKGKEREDLGGYEIRRMAGGTLGSLTREDWKARTLYFERIPIQHRTIPSIVQFILSLLATNDVSRVQSVMLPPHHADRQGSIPKCKGFAFVTFSSPEDAKALLERWPWEQNTPASTVLEEAERFGLRTLSQARWDELKEEYLSYRKTLIERVHDDGVLPSASTSKVEVEVEDARPSITSAPPPASEDTSPTHPRLSLNDPYPYRCLLFVRNIHPATNKTTLRSLFSSVFKHSDRVFPGEVIDYVDFNKGMDSCYLRLPTPAHTDVLSSHFSTHPTVQSHSLDEEGSCEGGMKHIEVEVVEGKREAVYWEKVPEKVRRGAVVKAVGLMNTDLAKERGDDHNGKGKDSGDQDRSRQRKRRKHG